LTAKVAKNAKVFEKAATPRPPQSRHPPLERSVMRGTHEHRMDQVCMGGPDEPGHDGEGGRALELARLAFLATLAVE
jgi:hypothetical protein